MAHPDPHESCRPGSCPCYPALPHEGERATAPAYVVRVTVDAEPIALPLRIHVGREFQRGENLDDIAFRTASKVLSYFPEGYCDEVRAKVYPFPADSCTGDADPVPVGEGVAH